MQQESSMSHQHYTQNMIFNVGKHLTVYMEFESIGLKFKKSIESFFIQKLCPFGVLPNEFSLNFERVAVSLKKCKKKESEETLNRYNT